MGRRLKVYSIVLDDLIPVMIMAFGYDRKSIIKNMETKFPAIKTAAKVKFMKPILISTSTVFGIDTEMEIITNNRDIEECLNFDGMVIDEEGNLVYIDNKVRSLMESVKNEEDTEEEKSSEEKADKPKRWA